MNFNEKNIIIWCGTHSVKDFAELKKQYHTGSWKEDFKGGAKRG